MEKMLEAPPAWNEVPDLMMEAEDSRMIAATKKKRKELNKGQRKWRRKDEIRPEKREHSPRFQGGHIILQGSSQKSGTSYNKRMMNCKCRVNGRE